MYEVGDSVPLSWRVINAQQALVDVPEGSVTLTVVPPGGAPTGAAVVHDSIGQFSSVYVRQVPGRHTLRWQATGVWEASHSDIINVEPAQAPVAIISLAEAKQHMQMDFDDHSEDDELLGFIAAASRVVEQQTKSVWAKRTIAETVPLDGTGPVFLEAAPIVELVGVVDADDNEVTGAVVAEAANGIVRLAASGVHTFTVVAGVDVIPENIRKATEIVCAHLWRTQRVQTIGAGPGFGGVDAAVVPGRGYLIPNQAAQLLGGRVPNRP